MWFNPRELQTQQHPHGDSCDFGDFSSYEQLKVAEIAKVATPPLLKSEERDVIITWLNSIGETNAEAIASAIRRCQEDMAVRDYFLGVAMAHKTANMDIDDDRRYCHQCANLNPTGHCLAAWRGENKASRNYRLLGDLPLRCEGYQPKPDDPDQRQAYERWPKLFNKNDQRSLLR